MARAKNGESELGEQGASHVLRALLVPIYLPTALQFSGSAAILPILPLIALRLGFSVSQAAALGLIGGLISVVGTVPVSKLMVKLGERRALLTTGAALIAINVLLGLLIDNGLSHGVHQGHRVGLVLALIIQAVGMVVWNLGRQAYLGAHLPPHVRARGMTTFGGAMRVGDIAGPMLSAAVLWLGHPSWVFYLYGIMLAFASVCVFAAMLEGDAPHAAAAPTPAAGTSEPVSEPATVTATIGRQLTVKDMVKVAIGILPLTMVRTNRPIIMPLLAVLMGLGEKDVTLIFGLSACVEILLFYPAGVIMDRWGRVAAVVPCMLILALGLFIAAPFAMGTAGLDAGNWAFVTLLGAQIVMGIGNGLGSGIMMTLGVDMSNSATRTADLARWNTFIGAGRLLAPLMVSSVTLVAPIGWAAALSGLILLIGGGWLFKILPEYGLGRERS